MDGSHARGLLAIVLIVGLSVACTLLGIECWAESHRRYSDAPPPGVPIRVKIVSSSATNPTPPTVTSFDIVSHRSWRYVILKWKVDGKRFCDMFGEDDIGKNSAYSFAYFLDNDGKTVTLEGPVNPEKTPDKTLDAPVHAPAETTGEKNESPK